MDSLNQLLEKKGEEIGVLRAKINLDLIDMKLTIVAEYPDLVEDNNHLIQRIEQFE
jgi:hypothetical protein